jgi:hypothetical protein
MQRVARSILAALYQVSADERARLLTTFGAWLDCGGSLADPRGIAELTLAFEIDRRIASPASIRTAPHAS